MDDTNHNTNSTPKGPQLPATGDKNRHCESITLTTLGDGHTMPSIFAVTPAASTKVEKLMDTLSAVFGSTFGAGKAKLPLALTQEGSAGGRAKDLSADRHIPLRLSQRAKRFRVIVFLVDTPVGIEKGFSPSESTTSRNLSRYTFDMFGEPENRTKKETASA